MEIEREGFTVEEAILSSRINDQNLGPIRHKEFLAMANGDNVEALRKDIDRALQQANMNANDISRLTGHLIGHEGSGGGVLDRLEKGQETLLVAVESIKESIQGLTTLHMTDVSELKKEIDNNSHDIKEVKVIAERADCKADKHIESEAKGEETKRKKWGARSWDLMKSLLFIALGFLMSRLT